MSERQAFRIFIRFQLQMMTEEGKNDLTQEEVEKFANGIEDDPMFYEQLGDFLSEYIEDFGSNYGIEW
ncbi:hypothetical protein [Cytobacillus horneckiae]|uniref:hypothetical protein n=1 Tax=Cytobacillus horneckiae TaxID=549687 RepID=UPI00203A6D6E|nr:hypothetical protein [Cytobacillus horneckiae]MCM3180208.1 hypothetical protein [Cytobacillus horneckiae]